MSEENVTLYPVSQLEGVTGRPLLPVARAQHGIAISMSTAPLSTVEAQTATTPQRGSVQEAPDAPLPNTNSAPGSQCRRPGSPDVIVRLRSGEVTLV